MQFVHPETQAFLKQLQLEPLPPLSELGPQGARDLFDEVAPQFDLPSPIEPTQMSLASKHGPIGAYLFEPNAAVRATILYLHGGGWVVGGLDTHKGLCGSIAELTNCRLVLLDYRRAPEHPFPAAFDDAKHALDALLENSERWGRIIVAGDSAGGALAASICQQVPDNRSVLLQWLIYPVTDLSRRSGSWRQFADGYSLTAADMDWYIGQYCDLADTADWRASPLLGEITQNTPPAIVVTASLDILSDEGKAYAGALKRAGVRTDHAELNGFVHGCWMQRKLFPAAESDLRACCKIVIDYVEAETLPNE